jgi:hypothetical protein
VGDLQVHSLDELEVAGHSAWTSVLIAILAHLHVKEVESHHFLMAVTILAHLRMKEVESHHFLMAVAYHFGVSLVWIPASDMH